MSKMILDGIGIMNTRSYLLTLVYAYSVIKRQKIKYQVLFLSRSPDLNNEKRYCKKCIFRK